MEDRHFAILLEIKESLGSLHAKVDDQERDLESHQLDDDEAHARIASLEATRSEVKGSYAVLAIGIAVVSSLLTVIAHAWVAK